MNICHVSARRWATVCLLLASSAASATVVDFDDYSAGTIIDDEYAAGPGPGGVFISADNFNNALDVAVVFDTNNITGGDTDLRAPFFRGDEALSPGNVLIIQENGPCSATACDVPDDEGARAAGKFILEFVVPVILESIDFFDIEEPESMGSIQLFDNQGALLPDMFAVPDTGGNNTWDSVVFNVVGVKRVEILMGGSGAIDNIAFSVIPVPAAAWLFSSSFLLLAGLRRRMVQSAA